MKIHRFFYFTFSLLLFGLSTLGHASSDTEDLDNPLHMANSLAELAPDTEVLDLKDKEIHASFPAEICACPNLHTLNLSGNYFDGPLPPKFNSLENLESIDLMNVHFSGTLHSFTSFEKLTYLRLGSFRMVFQDATEETHVSGPIPPEIGRLKNLRYLEIQSPFILGPFPQEFSQLTHLKELFLFKCQLNRPFPSVLCEMVNLTRLKLIDCGLTGGLPEQIGNLIHLQSLALSDNRLMTGPLPEALWTLVNLETLDFYKTNLNGVLSPNIKNLTKLRYLQLLGCDFEGPFPDVLDCLPLLENLNLCQTKFSGSLRFVAQENLKPQHPWDSIKIELHDTKFDRVIIEDHRDQSHLESDKDYIFIDAGCFYDTAIQLKNLDLSPKCFLGCQPDSWQLTYQFDVSDIRTFDDLWRLDSLYNVNRFLFTGTDETLFEDISFNAYDNLGIRFNFDTKRREVKRKDNAPLNDDQQRLQDILTQADEMRESRQVRQKIKGPSND